MRDFKACGFLLILALAPQFHFPAFAEENSTLNLDPITVTKSKTPLQNYYVMSSGELQDLPSDSPVEALQYAPLDLQSRLPKSGVQSDFTLRGSTFQQVLVLLNGKRINDPQTAHHNADIPLTKEDVERIDVIPGPASAIFGPDGIGGAVNFTVKKPQENKMVVEAKGGQYKTWSGLMSATTSRDNFAARLSVENEGSSGFHEDTDYKKFTTAFSSFFEAANGEVQADFGYQQKEFGAFDFYTPGLGFLSKEWTRTLLFNTQGSWDMAGFTIKPGFLWRRHFDKFALDKTFTRSTYLNHHRTDMFTPVFYIQKDMAGLGKAGSGVEFGDERIDSTNLGKHIRNHKSIFGDYCLDLTDNLSSAVTARIDDYDTFGEEYSGSLNFKYQLSKEQSLRLGIDRAIRVPSFTELYYSDPTTMGNDNLSAEKAINLQTGYDFKDRKLSGGLTLFYRRERDSIDWVKHSLAQGKWQVENITRADVVGEECYFNVKIYKWVELDSTYTYTDKRVDEQGLSYKYGLNYSRHLTNTLLIFHLPIGAQSIGLTYKKKPGRDGWFLLNSRLSYNISRSSQIFLEATNILSVGFEEIEGIPSPGRWVEGGLRFEW
ncbi:MAG: TonB-dependent receptor [Candidatus Omnitrophota bacterium]